MTRPVAQSPERADPQLRPRYAGVATFFRRPLRETAAGVDVAVVRRAFRRRRHGSHRRAPRAAGGARADDDDPPLQPGDRRRTVRSRRSRRSRRRLGRRTIRTDRRAPRNRRRFSAVRAASVVPLSVGGDHSISLAILRAVAKGGPLGMVHIDAHCDTGDDYLGSRFHHGAPFRRAVEEGLLDPSRVIQIGIRGSLGAATVGLSAMKPACACADRGIRRSRLALGGRGGAAHRRRRPRLSVVRHRFAGSGLRAGDRNAGIRRPHHARSAKPDARIARRRFRRSRPRRSLPAVRSIGSRRSPPRQSCSSSYACSRRRARGDAKDRGLQDWALRPRPRDPRPRQFGQRETGLVVARRRGAAPCPGRPFPEGERWLYPRQGAVARHCPERRNSSGGASPVAGNDAQESAA